MAVKKVKLKNMSGDEIIPDVGIPSQTGNNGKVLGTNGSSLVWVTQQGGGAGVWTYDSSTETLSISSSDTWTYDSQNETLAIG